MKVLILIIVKLNYTNVGGKNLNIKNVLYRHKNASLMKCRVIKIFYEQDKIVKCEWTTSCRVNVFCEGGNSVLYVWVL